MLQEAAVGSCNGGHGNYNIGGYYNGSGYNVVSYAIVVCSALHKQLCWELGVNHNCICIISEGPLMYAMTYLETLYSEKILLVL